MGNIHVKLYQIWTSGSGRDFVKRKSLGTRDDRQRPITIAHLEPSAEVSKKKYVVSFSKEFSRWEGSFVHPKHVFRLKKIQFYAFNFA